MFVYRWLWETPEEPCQVSQWHETVSHSIPPFLTNYSQNSDGEKFDIALEQTEQEYERELQKKKQDFEHHMSQLDKQIEELKDTRDEYRREKDKLEKKLEECEQVEKQLIKEKNIIQAKSTQGLSVSSKSWTFLKI